MDTLGRGGFGAVNRATNLDTGEDVAVKKILANTELAVEVEKEIKNLLASNKPVSYCNVESSCGHDAFLLPNEVDRYGQLMAGFLNSLPTSG